MKFETVSNDLILAIVAILALVALTHIAVKNAGCYHGGERYSNGARVEFSTGAQVCRAGEWVKS